MFTSSNTSVVTVSGRTNTINNEIVKSTVTLNGVGYGTATITVSSTKNPDWKKTCSVTVKKLKIYQTEKTFSNDATGNLSEDLKYNDIDEDTLKTLDWINWSDFVGTNVDDFRFSWEYMCTTLFSTGLLQDVILDMIDHFMEGTGTNYSNSILTQEAQAHDSTQQYISAVKSKLNNLLDEYNGDIYALQYFTESREENPLVQSLKGTYQPVFNTSSDKINGLTICVDSLWGNQIEVKSYQRNGNNYSGTLIFTLYDHFGLDEMDVSKYGYLAGFRAWYILQHSKTYSGVYKPFITVMEFEIPFSGTID